MISQWQRVDPSVIKPKKEKPAAKIENTKLIHIDPPLDVSIYDMLISLCQVF